MSLHDGAPGFGDLITKDRFFLRARSIKQQIASQMKHPLFLEMTLARAPSRIDRIRRAATEWKAMKAAGKDRQMVHLGEPLDVSKLQDGLMLTHGGSSMGNVG
jgi:hypothetical protein